MSDKNPNFVLVNGFARRAGFTPGCWLRRCQSRKEPLALSWLGPSERRRPLFEREFMFRRVTSIALIAASVLVAAAVPAFAAGATPDPALSGVIDNLRNWVVGLLAALATLFLTVGGVRY